MLQHLHVLVHVLLKHICFVWCVPAAYVTVSDKREDVCQGLLLNMCSIALRPLLPRWSSRMRCRLVGCRRCYGVRPYGGRMQGG